MSPATPPLTPETTYWKSSPSQWLNISHYFTAIIIATAIIVGGVFFQPLWFAIPIPFLYAGWRFLVIRCHTFEVTTERLRISYGVINQHIDEVELYRVKDILVKRLWWMRLTGLGSIFLETSDRTMPKVTIPAIKDPIDVREALRRKVEAQRDRKRVREMDFDDVNADFG